jgi:16S rRNA (cytidine1402-2'-O)-methyltransferase
MNSKKRQELPGLGLWVVATPIGNLEDLSPRARTVLMEASTVLCEDTRRTARLMSAIGASTRLERFDEHSTEGRVKELVERLSEGERIALVTDAGTPAISDPGARLVAAARAVGIPVTPVPGPSAVATLLSVCGFQSTAFVFRGFFPRKSGDQKSELKLAQASELSRIFVWFESPNRVVAALEAVAREVAGARVCAAKELTKLHERFFFGGAREVATAVREEIEREGELGEWSFAVELESRDRSPEQELESSEWVKALECMRDSRISASEAAERVSQYFGVSKKISYEAALKIYGKK